MIENSLLCLCLLIFQNACSESASTPDQSPQALPKVGYLTPDFSLEMPEKR
jgi:hypothetical protein